MLRRRQVFVRLCERVTLASMMSCWNHFQQGGVQHQHYPHMLWRARHFFVGHLSHHRSSNCRGMYDEFFDAIILLWTSSSPNFEAFILQMGRSTRGEQTYQYTDWVNAFIEITASILPIISIYLFEGEGHATGRKFESGDSVPILWSITWLI